MALPVIGKVCKSQNLARTLLSVIAQCVDDSAGVIYLYHEKKYGKKGVKCTMPFEIQCIVYSSSLILFEGVLCCNVSCMMQFRYCRKMLHADFPYILYTLLQLIAGFPSYLGLKIDDLQLFFFC